MESVSEINSIMKAALSYLEVGFSVIPMRIYFEKPNDIRAKKQPSLSSWMEFKERCPTIDETKKYFQNPHGGVAIVTGTISNLVVIDIDLGASEERIKYFNSFPTLTSKTPSGGQHRYYWLPKGAIISTKADVFGGGSHIDIRAEGGLIIAPPSKYPNGVPYEWEGDFCLDKITELPSELLKAIQEQEKLHHGKSNFAELANGVGDGSRNDGATSIIGSLLSRYSPSDWDALCWPLIRGWNELNKPPMSTEELARIYKSIKGRELSRNPRENEIVPLGQAMSLTELLTIDFPAAAFAVDRLFEAETINMLSAPPNKWKSWLALHLAICLASGKNFLGEFKTQKQGVLIVNEEDTERMLQERCRMLMDGMGITDELPIYFHIGKNIKLTKEFVDQIIQEAREKNIGFIIFDSLRSVHVADENSSKEMQVVMDQLKRIMREHFTVLFTHHNRKLARSGKRGNDWGEESRGSSAINAAIHGHLSCEEIEKDGKLYLVVSQSKLKAAAKILPFGVKIEKEGNQMRFSYDGEFKGKSQLASEENQSIFKAIEKSEEWLGVKDLVGMGYGKATTIRPILKRLSDKHSIQCYDRKDVAVRGFSAHSQNGGHNEKLYFRSGESATAMPPL